LCQLLYSVNIKISWETLCLENFLETSQCKQLVYIESYGLQRVLSSSLSYLQMDYIESGWLHMVSTENKWKMPKDNQIKAKGIIFMSCRYYSANNRD
jgi:predicted aldo/keto reductase-like oxidoreductase